MRTFRKVEEAGMYNLGLLKQKFFGGNIFLELLVYPLFFAAAKKKKTKG